MGSWLSGYVAKPRARVRLFCLPFAGGGTLTYRSWSSLLGEEVEVCPVQLPGRESRLSETPERVLARLVPRIAEAFAGAWSSPFALFGHSMGALIAFELARELRRRLARLPVHLFVSGRPGPRQRDPDPPMHDLPEPEFIARLRDFNGTPPVVLENAEMRNVFLPTLRADLALCETYVYRPEPPLSCPITAFGGRDDRERPPHRLEPWGEETSQGFELHVLPGDHFFVRSAEARVLELIRARLSEAKP